MQISVHARGGSYQDGPFVLVSTSDGRYGLMVEDVTGDDSPLFFVTDARNGELVSSWHTFMDAMRAAESDVLAHEGR